MIITRENVFCDGVHADDLFSVWKAIRMIQYDCCVKQYEVQINRQAFYHRSVVTAKTDKADDICHS